MSQPSGRREQDRGDPAVTAVVVNWDSGPYIRGCLSSLRDQTYQGMEIIVVDNGSRDGSPELVEAFFPEVQLIRNERNLGFAGANNLAIQRSRGRYVATLNSDVEVTPGWLESLVAAMESDDRVGMCASKLLFFLQREIINSTGICLDKVGFAWDRWGGKKDTGMEEAIEDVFGPCGAAALYRRSMLDEIGLFDKDFFAYLEDVDLAWRARLAGWRCLYVPQARGYHVLTGSGTLENRQKNYLLGRNKVRIIIKNYPRDGLIKFFPAILLYDLLAVGCGLLARREGSLLWGRIAGLMQLPELLRKRREVKRMTKLSWEELSRLMHPVESPLAVYRRYAYLRRIHRPEHVRAG